ncbi:hypothetical protein TNCV_1183851 [Trichonephila clavipes]|nr:hypothetical protein TNCV_1183851 [Trichonephila clavipes]
MSLEDGQQTTVRHASALTPWNSERVKSLIHLRKRGHPPKVPQTPGSSSGRRQNQSGRMEIGSRVVRNQTTVMRICDRWMQEGTTDRRGRLHPPLCTTSLEDRQIVRMAVTVTTEWSVRKTSIAWSTLDAEPQMSPPPMGLATAIFQQNNVRPHVARIVQRFFVNHKIELLPWSARSPDLSPIENMWSMVAQQLTQITPPAATPDQL